MKRIVTPPLAVGTLARWAVLLVAIGFITGCVMYQAPVKPPFGGIYTDIKSPLTANYNGNPTGAGTTKVSKDFTHYIFDPLITRGSFAWRDVSVAKIAREGGIKEVSYADYEVMSVLGIYARFTINVYGN